MKILKGGAGYKYLGTSSLREKKIEFVEEKYLRKCLLWNWLM
jgi:hypothetical protein